MEQFRREIHPTTKPSSVVYINFDGLKLSLTGRCCGSYGQVAKYIREAAREPGYEGFGLATIDKLCDLWDRWHLNDMRAGTPRQEQAVLEQRQAGNCRHYDEACKYLKSIGLYIDDGYEYGTAWRFEEVPQDVIEWLFSLPGKGDSVGDVYPVEVDEDSFLAAICPQIS